MGKELAEEKAVLTRASFSSPAGLAHLRSWSNSALAPLAAELEDLVELFAESPKEEKRWGASPRSCNEGSEPAAAWVPTVRAPGPAHLRTRSRWAPLRFCAALILVALLGVVHTGRRWTSEQRRVRQLAQPGPRGAPREAEAAAAERDYLKAGSVYQNAYMTLWNENGGPISVTLEVGEGDSFELKVNHLNSINNGNKGWFVLRGSFQTEPMEANDDMRRIVPEPSNDEQAFLYDPKVLDRACSVAYKCMERVGMLGVVKLEVNVKEDTVLVTPKSSIVRIFWDEPVVLRLTKKEDIWAPKALEEGSAEKPAES